MNPTIWMLTVLISLLCLGGCKSGSIEEDRRTTQFNPNLVKLNAAPVAKYDIPIEFIDIDASDFRVEIKARYVVTTDACVAIDYGAALGGLALKPEQSLTLPVNKVAGNLFATQVRLDAIMDGNYFGQGTCKWALDAVSVLFFAGERTFVAGIDKTSIEQGLAQARYFLKSDINTSSNLSNFVFGEQENFYKKELGPQFQVVLRATKVSNTLSSGLNRGRLQAATR